MGRMAACSGQPIRRHQNALESTRSLLSERLAWDADPPVPPDDGRYPVAKPGRTKVL